MKFGAISSFFFCEIACRNFAINMLYFIFICISIYLLLMPLLCLKTTCEILCYRISSPISLVIFSESDTEISEIFHEKRGSSYSQGFEIQKQFLNLLVLLFFADNTSSVGRSLTFRVSAYR